MSTGRDGYREKRLKLERETGIEPATNGLGSRDSTTELLPLAEGCRPDSSRIIVYGAPGAG